MNFFYEVIKNRFCGPFFVRLAVFADLWMWADTFPVIETTVPSVLSVPDDLFFLWHPVEKGGTPSKVLVMSQTTLTAMQVYFLFVFVWIS